MLAWFSSGALRCLLALFSASTQTLLAQDTVEVLVRLVVVVELYFFVRAFRSWIDESITIQTGSYREMVSALAQFLTSRDSTEAINAEDINAIDIEPEKG